MTEDIPILLPKTARNYDLEYPLIKDIETHQSHSISESPSHILSSIGKTLTLLESFKGHKSWEWEDEEYWSKEYQNESGAVHQKEWDVRIWQMEWLMDQLMRRTDLRGKTILDVGCGEGQIFRTVLSQYCDDDSLYIATDVSIDGLRLNRARNKQRNAIYVLCSADRLPFRDKVVDLLCYFGILHHTERKSGTIRQDSEIVANDGYVIIHEATDRPYISSVLPFMRPGEESAHEGRIKKKDLMTTISTTKELQLIASREAYTILFGFMRYVSGIKYLNRKWFYHTLLGLDLLFLKAFGWISPALGSGEVMLLLRKSGSG